MMCLFPALLGLVLIAAGGPGAASRADAGGDASADASEYSWSISWSAEGPDSVAIAPFQGVAMAYLWLSCSEFDGFSAAELDIDGSALVAGFQPMNGVLNIGTPKHLMLAIGGCPRAPFLAGAFTVIGQGEEGDLCFGQRRVTVDCDTLRPASHPSGARGCVIGGQEPCEFEVCTPTLPAAEPADEADEADDDPAAAGEPEAPSEPSPKGIGPGS